MLGHLLVSAVVTTPYVVYQGLTGKTGQQTNHIRNRIFGGTFTLLCAAQIGLAGFVVAAAKADQPDAGRLAGRTAALPIAALAVGYGTKKGWGRQLLTPYKKEEEAEQE